MKKFFNKVIVITGAGSGMGRSYVQAFAKLGAHFALNDYDADALKETVAELKREHPQLKVISSAFDVSHQDAMERFAEDVQRELGGADVVINNAGVEGLGQPTWATPSQSYRRVMDINFFGVVHGTQAFLPQLLEKSEGAVVNISSIFGLIGPPNHSDYSASKFAVRGFTEALMVELLNTSISVHLVHPGGIDTNIARAEQSQAFSQKYLTTSPDDIVDYVIDAIRHKKARIVYGNDALKTWLGSIFVPLKWLIRLVWRDMRDVIDQRNYPARGNGKSH
ncbi:short-chain dehydrogenase/reductase SDR [gamma proteobacterium HTCC5015]|nr:short-chain dehydrogenase/reductase SDR [gamma proteobacterium HTCC5015]